MSTLQHTRNSVSLALKNIKDKTPTLNVERVTQIDSNFARIVGTINAQASAEQIGDAVRKLSKKLTPVQGSFVSIACNSATRSIEGIVGVVTERVVLSDNNRDAFQSLSSNMYMDNEEQLWSLKKTDGGDILIKSHAGDDLEVMNSLMACVASSQVGVQETLPAAQRFVESRRQVEGGDLLAYVSPKTGTTVLGFAIAAAVQEDGSDAGLIVVDRNDNLEQISRELVVAYTDQVETDDTTELEAVAAGNFSLEMMKDYYRRLFVRSPEYFEEFWKRLSGHAYY